MPKKEQASIGISRVARVLHTSEQVIIRATQNLEPPLKTERGNAIPISEIPRVRKAIKDDRQRKSWVSPLSNGNVRDGLSDVHIPEAKIQSIREAVNNYGESEPLDTQASQ